MKKQSQHPKERSADLAESHGYNEAGEKNMVCKKSLYGLEHSPM